MQLVDGQISQFSNFVHLLGAPSWQGKGEVQAKNAEKAAALPSDKAKVLDQDVFRSGST
jgi:hypothetical protein